MAYVAHVGIDLKNDECPKEKDIWHFIKETNGVQYLWKFSKNHTYHVIADVFDNPHKALSSAKRMYVNILYHFVRNGIQIADAGCSDYERCFFWNKQHYGGELGLGVFEVESSIHEFDEYRFLSGKLIAIRESDLNLTNIDDNSFTYCKESQKLINTILLAENASDFGLKMTIYCGLLEHLSEDNDKDQDVLDVIEELINYVKSNPLAQGKKDTLLGLLKNGQKLSSSQKIHRICEQFAESNYGRFSCREIIKKAYSIRSSYSHGEDCSEKYSERAANIKFVALDVVKNYMMHKEELTLISNNSYA